MQRTQSVVTHLPSPHLVHVAHKLGT
jgi:hypothetical protein